MIPDQCLSVYFPLMNDHHMASAYAKNAAWDKKAIIRNRHNLFQHPALNFKWERKNKDGAQSWLNKECEKPIMNNWGLKTFCTRVNLNLDSVVVRKFTSSSVRVKNLLPMRQSLFYFSGVGKFCLAPGLRQLTRNVKNGVRILNFRSEVTYTPPRKTDE